MTRPLSAIALRCLSECFAADVTGVPEGGSRFLGHATELEYGVNGWWTSEWYLDGQVTAHESALFTGYRWENWFRLLPSPKDFRRQHYYILRLR